MHESFPWPEGIFKIKKFIKNISEIPKLISIFITWISVIPKLISIFETWISVIPKLILRFILISVPNPGCKCMYIILLSEKQCKNFLFSSVMVKEYTVIEAWVEMYCTCTAGDLTKTFRSCNKISHYFVWQIISVTTGKYFVRI